MTTPEAGTQFPPQLTEIHRLKLHLVKETQGRLQAESINLQMAKKALDMAMQKAHADHTVLMEELKTTYGLADGDSLLENGLIVRAKQNGAGAAPAKLAAVPPPAPELPPTAPNQHERIDRKDIAPPVITPPEAETPPASA